MSIVKNLKSAKYDLALRLVQQGREMADAKEKLVAAAGLRLGRHQSRQALTDTIERLLRAREDAEGVGAYGGREATALEGRLALATRLVEAKEEVAEALRRSFTAEQVERFVSP